MITKTKTSYSGTTSGLYGVKRNSEPRARSSASNRRKYASGRTELLDEESLFAPRVPETMTAEVSMPIFPEVLAFPCSFASIAQEVLRHVCSPFIAHAVCVMHAFLPYIS